jgi:hypothetical protein
MRRPWGLARSRHIRSNRLLGGSGAAGVSTSCHHLVATCRQYRQKAKHIKAKQIFDRCHTESCLLGSQSTNTCRQYCARRLRSLYTSLKFLHGKGRYTKKKLDNVAANDAR